MPAAPPPAIEQRLSALVPRVRALRVARGASGLVVAALAGVGVALLADAAFPLAAWARGLVLSVWLTAVGVLAWRWVVVPWHADISLDDIAREVEKRLPELGERLRAAVADGPFDAVRAAVAEDTARRAKAVDLARAISVGPVARFVARAVGVLATASTAVWKVPNSGDRLLRVALPWHRPDGAPAFRVVVTSGEPVVNRGSSVTLSAYSEGADSGTTAQTAAVLVVTDLAHAAERRVPMTGDGAAFHVTLPAVTDTFDYCVEVGGARSEWLRVTALDAVEVTEGTSVEIVAPAYAKRPARTLTAFADVDGLQFGTATFRLVFTHPAAAAHLDWRPEGAAKSDVLALHLDPDRRGAKGVFPLAVSGVLRLVLVREAEGKRLRTDTTVRVRVARDAPPWFEEVSGVTARPRTARPGTRVPITFVARDDISLSGASLEYVPGAADAQPVAVPLSLTSDTARHDFDLTDKGRAGDTIRFRIRVTDNRKLDDPKLTPQDAFYPASGWSELKLDTAAPPLDQQDPLCQRDALHEALSAARTELSDVASEADALRTETAGRAALAVDHAVRLHNAREKLLAAVARLHAAAGDAVLTPELRPLATAARAVADEQLKAADAALRAAETDHAAARNGGFTAAAARLAEADGKLSELQVRNARLAQRRLDVARLNRLAADQAALANADGTDALARQRELLARFAAVVAESDPLRNAAGGAKAEEARRFAVALGELAARLRELDADAKRTVADARAAIAAAVERDADALAKEAATTFGKLQTPARLAGVALPAPDDLRRVAQLTAAGRTVEALAELEKHALAFERVAAAFDKWHADRADPKLAAKQLARWQDDLLARFGAVAKGGGFAKLPDGEKAALRAEQKALHATVEALALPPDPGVRAVRDNATRHTARANECLALDGAGADRAMKLAADVLDQLSDRTPTVAERLAASARAFDRLRQDLEVSANAVELALKGFDRQSPDPVAVAALTRKLAPHGEAQHKLVAAVAALDLPGLGARQARIGLALTGALSDMRAGSPLDVPASQAWVRREFDRLKLALDGHTPPDVKAEELFRTLATQADALDAYGPTVTRVQVDPALPVAQDVQRQLALVVAPEAPALLNDARAAVREAESAFRGEPPTAIRRRVRAAAGALGKLADRLAGAESDFDRVGRLAASRRLAAENPKELLSSGEALRQLGREADELAATRVGPAGQALKKRALDLYAKLRSKTDLDRAGTDLKTLATTLNELAAKMADVAELTAGVGRAPPRAAPAADDFLPSGPLAGVLRTLAKRQRAIHAKVASRAPELAGVLRPADARAIAAKQLAVALALTKSDVGAELVARLCALSDFLGSPPAAAARQIARAGELARRAGEFAELLREAATTFAPDDATGAALAEAAKAAGTSGNHLAESAKKAADGDTAKAAAHRAAADALLRSAIERLNTVAPPAATSSATGLALRSAEKAMRSATAALAEGNAAAARDAMRAAAAALGQAAESVRR